jgi:hypothetical protein
MQALAAMVDSLVTGVRAINRKYAIPQIQMTLFVKACLLTLRIYLFVLVGLLLYKFIITLQG